MGDPVEEILRRFREAHGQGAPAQAPTPSQTPTTVNGTYRAINPTSTDSAIDKYKGVVANYYTKVSGALATVDPSLKPVVDKSSTETTTARTSLDRTSSTYQQRITALTPVSNTIGGQLAINGTRVQAVTEGASETRGTVQNDRLRKVLVEILARKIAAQQQQAGSNGGGSGTGGGTGAGTGGGGTGGGGGGGMPSQSGLPTAQYSPQQIAALTALLSSSKKKSGGGKGSPTSTASLTTSGAGINVPGGTSEAARKAIASALAKRGLPYGWGANGPNSYDCSSLMVAAVKDATGTTIPRTTYDQIRLGQPVSTSAVKPGDLVFSNFSAPGTPEHVQMYIGNGQVVHAPQPGDVVKISNYVPSGAQIRRIFQ